MYRYENFKLHIFLLLTSLEKRSHTLLSNENFASRIGFVGAAHVLVIYALLMVIKFWAHTDARATRSNILGNPRNLMKIASKSHC